MSELNDSLIKDPSRWRNLGKKLKPLVPGIAALLGGPAVGAGARVLVDLFQTENPTEIENRIQNISDVELAALRRADAEVQMKDIEAEIAYQESGTRRLESDNATNSRFVQFLRPGTAVFWNLVMFGLIIYGIAFLNEEREQLFQVLLTTVVGILYAIIGFYFPTRGLEKIAAIVTNRIGEQNQFKGIIPTLLEKRKAKRNNPEEL